MLKLQISKYQVQSQDSYLKGCGWKDPNCMDYLDVYLKDTEKAQKTTLKKIKCSLDVKQLKDLSMPWKQKLYYQ